MEGNKLLKRSEEHYIDEELDKIVHMLIEDFIDYGPGYVELYSKSPLNRNRKTSAKKLVGYCFYPDVMKGYFAFYNYKMFEDEDTCEYVENEKESKVLDDNKIDRDDERSFRS